MLSHQKNLLLRYFLLLFALTIPFYLFGGMKLPIPVNLPVSALMLINPFLAAVILTYRHDGLAGIRRLFTRALDFQKIQHKVWYLTSLFLTPLIYALSYAIMRWVGKPLPDPEIPLLTALIFFIVYFFTSILEELGWQGYIFDPMQDRWGALTAGILLGLAWQFWHLIPLIQAQNSAIWIFWHMMEGVALRVLMSWIYINAGKSVFTAVLVHTTTNISWSLFPNFGSGYDPFFTALITWLVAGLVILGWRGKTLAQYRFANLSLLLILLLTITSACAPVQAGGNQAAGLPVPSQWKMVSLGKLGAETALIESSSITLGFDANGQVSGSAGCNAYAGKYRVQGNTLTFQEITSTRKACSNEQVTAQEQQYLEALKTTARYEIAGDTLTIWYKDGQNRLNFVKIPAD